MESVMEERDDEFAGASKSRISVWFLLAIWVLVFVIISVVFVVSQVMYNRNGFRLVESYTYWFIYILMMFFNFIMTSFFSFVILRHNITVRELSETSHRINESNNIRADEFRRLQFVASNYTVVDFTGDMLLYEEYKTYTEKLRATNDFTFYMREDSIDLKDVQENFDKYVFLSVKIPFRIAEGKNVAAIRISRFKFSKKGKDHRFVPCTGGNNTLILHDEADNHEVATLNLITRKDGEFYNHEIVMPFIKIKLNLTMYSLLGVATTGWTELYFTNPRKLGKGGVNVYKINSSQFKVSGLPTLLNSVGDDI